MELTYDPTILEPVNFVQRRYFSTAVMRAAHALYAQKGTTINRLPVKLNSAVMRVYTGADSLREAWKRERIARGEVFSVEELATVDGFLTGCLAVRRDLYQTFDFTTMVETRRRSLHVDESWNYVFKTHYEKAFRKAIARVKAGEVEKAALADALCGAMNALAPISAGEGEFLSDAAEVLAEQLAKLQEREKV